MKFPRKTTLLIVGGIVILGGIVYGAQHQSAGSGLLPSLFGSTSGSTVDVALTDAQPIGISARGTYVFAVDSAQTTLYSITTKTGTVQEYALPAAVVTAHTNPAESELLITTTREENPLILTTLATSSPQTLPDLLSADWVNDTQLIAFTKDARLVTYDISNPGVIALPVQMQPSELTNPQIEHAGYASLVRSTTRDDDLPLYRYWLITNNTFHELFDRAVSAILTPDGTYVTGTTVESTVVKGIRTQDVQSNTAPCTPIGTHTDKYTCITPQTASDGTEQWVITEFSPGSAQSVHAITAPISNTLGIFMINDIVYAYSNGLLYHGNIMTLINNAS